MFQEGRYRCRVSYSAIPFSSGTARRDRKSTRLNSSHTVIYRLSLHDALPILEYRRPDHTTSVCGDDHRFSVLQTEVAMQNGSVFQNRVKIEPHGKCFKKVDTGAESLIAPYLLAPEQRAEIGRAHV